MSLALAVSSVDGVLRASFAVFAAASLETFSRSVPTAVLDMLFSLANSALSTVSERILMRVLQLQDRAKLAVGPILKPSVRPRQRKAMSVLGHDRRWLYVLDHSAISLEGRPRTMNAELADGTEVRVVWQVQGNSELGLPTEQDLDIFVALGMST